MLLLGEARINVLTYLKNQRVKMHQFYPKCFRIGGVFDTFMLSSGVMQVASIQKTLRSPVCAMRTYLFLTSISISEVISFVSTNYNSKKERKSIKGPLVMTQVLVNS